MLRFLNRCFLRRKVWILVACVSFAMEMTALWFQHSLMLKPCVMCIYERCALWGIVLAGIVGAMAPKSSLRLVAIAIWIYSSWEGLHLTYQHTMMLLHPNPFTVCELTASFPDYFPLNKWLPSMFVATGDCSIVEWSFLTLSMPQWMMIIFALSLLTAISVLIALPFKPERRTLFSR